MQWGDIDTSIRAMATKFGLNGVIITIRPCGFDKTLQQAFTKGFSHQIGIEVLVRNNIHISFNDSYDAINVRWIDIDKAKFYQTLY